MLLLRPLRACRATYRSFATSPTARSKASQLSDGPLAGTSPAHRSYIFLHTNIPPSQFPSRISSSVQKTLQLRTAPWGCLVNFCWSEDQPIVAKIADQEDPQKYYLTAFSHSRGRMTLPDVSEENMDEVANRLQQHMDAPAVPLKDSDDDIHIYVCTHGSRDCRCGDTGGEVAKAFREELQRRKIQDPTGSSRRIKFAECAHVGGHKFAANVLVYPLGEWLGLVNAEDVPSILDEILSRPTRPATDNDPPLCPTHWRGRMGMSKDQQLQLHAAYSAGA